MNEIIFMIHHFSQIFLVTLTQSPNRSELLKNYSNLRFSTFSVEFKNVTFNHHSNLSVFCLKYEVLEMLNVCL